MGTSDPSAQDWVQLTEAASAWVSNSVPSQAS